MRDDRAWILLLALLAGVAVIFVAGPALRLAIIPAETVSLWRGAEIRCDDLTATVFLFRMPSRAVLHVDTDPSAPYWPFYYGAIVQIIVNDAVVKTYDPPLLDKDTVDITSKIRTGFNSFKLVPKVAAILCSVQTQGIVNGHLELTYPSDGGGGGDGVGGGPDLNTVLIAAGAGLTIISAYFIIRRR